jgi:tRNA pseudouridine55 synthase
VLPIALGEATKAIQFLDEGEKTYEAVIRLGVTTDTLDITGTVLHESHPSETGRQQLAKAVNSLTGEISQIPPMYSAIKQGGQPLYKLARKGIDVERPPRQVTIHSFEVLNVTHPFVAVKVRCSRGTYIRSLADDLGKVLGCGACLAELRRTVSGPFRLADAMTLDQLAVNCAEGLVHLHLLRLPDAVSHLTQIQLTGPEFQLLKNGIPPRDRLVDMHAGLVSLIYDNQLIAVVELTSEKGVTVKRVFN